MRTDSVKKYVIPNIPYLFILWACLKLGTAYRLAPGADFAHKLMGLGQSIGPAFADFAPGLAPFDWLIGIVGAVGFRLLIYFKSKNAKKFRRDEEYGSARWGTEKDIKPFVDPKFENNVILTKTEFLSMNTRPKNPANARNLNACIIGSSGSGKTRFWLTPQLLQAHCSYVCVDPKGGVLSQVGAFLQRRGYQVKVFNSIDFSKSMHYNPLSYIHNEADILKFVDTLIANTKGEGKEGDPFWTKAETLLYCALIAYIIFEAPAEDRNINTLVDMISGMDVKEDDESYMNAVDYMFKGLEKRKPDCFAVKQYKKYKLASGVVCSKRLLNQAVGKSLRTHNLKPKKGAQAMRKNEKITALYERLSRDDFGKDDDQQREKVLFLRLRLVPDVPDQGAVQKPLGLDPKIFGGFFSVAFGVGDDDIDQLQNILFVADIGEGIVFHALFEVDGVEDFNAVRLIDDLPVGIPHGLSVLVQLGGAPPQHGPHLGQKLSFGIGDHIGTVHLHEGGFDEKTGLAAAAAADDQDIG